MTSQQAVALREADAETTPDAALAHLLSPYRLGEFALENRLVMAPMTRSRAVDGNVPNPLAATYYAQRAAAGLIITEATQVSPQGVGYIRTPGIHSPEQVTGWRLVTDAVHRAGGKIFAQLWHVGRVSHPDFHDGALPVAPSGSCAGKNSPGTVASAPHALARNPRRPGRACCRPRSARPNRRRSRPDTPFGSRNFRPGKPTGSRLSVTPRKPAGILPAAPVAWD